MLQPAIQARRIPTYRGSVDEGIFELEVPCEELLVQEAGVFHIAEESEVNSIGRRHMLELYDFDGHDGRDAQEKGVGGRGELKDVVIEATG